jgi:hypothetical protein
VIISDEQKAANRAAFRAMGPAAKAEYIFAYYKFPLVVALVLLVAVSSVAHGILTHKDPVLYVAFANVVPPEDVDAALTSGYLEQSGGDTRRSEVSCYRELYLSNDASTANHQYAYASRIKLMAAVEGQELDVVLMNREAWDLLSASGYLRELSDAFGGDARIRTNTVVLESNQVELDLNESDTYEATTVDEANALEVTDAPLIAGFSGDEPLYLGVVANTPRLDEALAYLGYVSQTT